MIRFHGQLLGRRPSTDGLGISYRNDDQPKSPLSHTVDVEFDGASFRWNLDKVTPMTGSWIKLCMGRGLTNAKPRFDMSGTDYATDDTKNPDVDMLGFIFVPYDDGQYSISTNWARALNLIGYGTTAYNSFNAVYMDYYGVDGSAQGTLEDGSGTIGAPVTGTGDSLATFMNYANNLAFQDVGDMDLLTVMFKAEGIGDEISDFLDDTTFFASWAQSKTNPSSSSDITMLGSNDSKTGHSEWIGLNMPAGEDARWGIEWNQGSRYWRSVTYGEDTMVGSKLATRGTAWEVYYNTKLTKSLSAAIRYTDIEYDYTGSNGFFGVEGTPTPIASAPVGTVTAAQDLKAYIRYRF